MKRFVFFFFGAFLVNAYSLSISRSGGWLESAYAEWAPASGSSRYNVYVDNSKIHDPLIRSYGSYIRADIPGISAGKHTIRVAPVFSGNEGESASVTVSVKSHDRSGFAFHGGRVPGAYKMDGSLKDGAIVIYVTEKTKNSVSLTVKTKSDGATTVCKSFQGILGCLKKGYEDRPIAIRLVGNITDPDSLEGGDLLIDFGSSNNSYLTLEGIGEDATVNGWGIRLKNANNVEIRNLGIMNVNSSEGDNIGLQQNNGYIWVHNNDFFYGDAGTDADQAKGDGALDCKTSKYITFSYNHFWDNGKSNLLGLKEGVFSYNSTEYYITYHHNWYDHSDSRHPRIRYYNAHVYNNYYDGNAKYGAGSTLGSSVFMEGNYFRNCKYPMLTSMQGSDLYAGTSKSSTDNATFSKEAGGTIKAFDNYMTGNFTFIPYHSTSFTNNGKTVSANEMNINTQTDFDAYVVKQKTDTVPASVKSKSGNHYYSNFDTDASIMYSYTAEDPESAKSSVTAYAGRINGGDFKWTFDNSNDDASHSVNTKLKAALVSYASTLKTIQGEGEFTAEISSSSSGQASSSSQAASSSSVETSSSSVSSSSETSLLPIKNDITHNFTKEGKSSSYFLIAGNLAKDKGSIEANGEELSQCLKIESATSISFNLEISATLSLYFNTDFAKSVLIDGKPYPAKKGTVTMPLDKGLHTISKGESAYLYLIEIRAEKTEALTKAQKDRPRVLFDSFTQSLLIESSAVQNVEVFRIDGAKVLSTDRNRVSMIPYPRGFYLVRTKTDRGVFQTKIFVE